MIVLSHVIPYPAAVHCSMTKSNVRAPCFLLNFPPNRSIYWSRACLGKYCRCSSPRTPAAAAKKGMFLLSSPSRSQKKCLFEPFFYQKRSHAPAGSSAPYWTERNMAHAYGVNPRLVGAPAQRDRVAGLTRKQTRRFSSPLNFSLCLSRACLGKRYVFVF